MLRYLKITTFLLLIASLFSCRKDFERPNWDVELLAPLIKTSLNLEDLLPDTVLVTNPDTSLKVVYQTSIFDIGIDSLFQIPDTTITDVHSIAVSSIAAPGSVFYSEPEEYSLNVNNGVGLNLAMIESGFIEIEIYSEIKEKIIITYTVPSAIKNGDTLELVETINAATPGNPAHFKRKIDISGYDLDLTGVNHSEINTLVTRAVATVDPMASSSVTLIFGETITFNTTLLGVEPYFVRGYFGNQLLSYKDTAEVNVLNKIAGTIDLDEVDVNIEFKNGIGADAQILLNQFGALNTNTTNNVNLLHSSIGSPINLNRGLLTYSIPEVNYSAYNIPMNTINSNIDQLIETLPNSIIYDIDININPLGNISGGNDFVYKKHLLETNLNVEFPLSLIANNLALSDTLSFSLPNETQTGRIIDGTLFLYADNGFPFDAAIELSLFDESNNFLQTLNVSTKILAAPVDGNLRVLSPKQSVLSIPVSTATADNLYLANKMVFKIGFTTQPQSQFVKLYEGYDIDIQVVGDFSYNLSFN